MSKMNLVTNKSKASAIIFGLMLTFAATFGSVAINIPTTAAQNQLRLISYFYPMIGVNSLTLITFQPDPDIFQISSSPYYVEPWTSEMRWVDAVVTFTKPDGSTDVVNGPFEVYYLIYVDASLRVYYTPDMQGVWTVEFYWPGDATYEAVTKTATFKVGEHFEKRESFAMLSLRPYPAVGLGQSVLVNAWVTPPPMTDRENYRNYEFTWTSPSGNSFTIGPVDAESPGTFYFEYLLNELGEWTLRFEFPGDHFTLPCSVTRTIIVQEDPIPYPIEDTPLPTQPWDFPINVENREWRNIAGNWFQTNYNASGGGWNPYTEAPRTAHILWSLPPESGVGGFIGSPWTIQTSGMYSGSSAGITTIMAGKGYYTAGGQIHCIDIFTGEELWSVPGSFQTGAIRNRNPVLYYLGTRFIEYDALTGQINRDMTGLPPITSPPEIIEESALGFAYAGGTFYDDPYFYQCTSGWFNDTKGDWDDGQVIKFDTTTGRIVWNVTFAAGPLTSSYSTMYNGLLISRCFKPGTIVVQFLKALNLTTGELEYATPIMDKGNTNTWVYRQGPAVGAGYDLVYFAGTAYGDYPLAYFAFDAATGESKWVCRPPEEDYPWANFFAYMPQTNAYDKVFILSYAGIYAADIDDGSILWHFSPGDSGMETPYNSWPFGSTGAVIGGGVVYAPVTEHSPTFYYRGTKMYAVDAFTGEKVWDIIGYYRPNAVVYGILLAQDSSNSYTYAFSKGSTETTISVQDDVIGLGSSVLLKGSVLDMSPAQEGTAAIADEYMSEWMEYLHMQQPMPTDAKGVEVIFTVVDSNNNCYEIGRTTSSSTGQYSLLWMPEIPGEFQITATFAGSESYYSSSAETFLGVTQSPSPGQQMEPELGESNPTATEPAASEQTVTIEALITTEIAILLAAIIVAVAIVAGFWITKKRK
jgi:hypothetical protein